jgi:hypothetical protein
MANFYRNRDPYKAYFHSQGDKYLTTHLLESVEFNFGHSCLDLEYRLGSSINSYFFQAIHELYQGKKLIVPNDYFFNIDKLEEATGEAVLMQDLQLHISENNIDSLLQQGKYSYFYSPFLFSTLNESDFAIDKGKYLFRCFQYVHPWGKEDFPLLIVLLKNESSSTLSYTVLHHGKYLFFLPSDHPMLEF